ncbi:MAG: response regulator transcription factor [Flavobacterium sp.]|nr:MAG: response regulator transcription factor [Flavobacterium sp.]
MIKTIIIDDEYNASEFLEKMLKRYFPNKFHICKTCENIDDAVKAIEEHQPDLVFLDIQMPNKNGFELFKEIKEINFEVIFTTAHSEYAIDAIKRSALDYLLKPINYIDLLGAVNRFEQKNKKENQEKQLNILIENIDSGDTAHKKIAIATETGFEFVKFNTIIYLEAQNNYTKFNLTNGSSITTSKTLKHFEEILPSELFFRIHKSYLVNMNFIKRFTKGDEQFVELITGQQLPVSIRKKDEFINAITKKTNA